MKAHIGIGGEMHRAENSFYVDQHGGDPMDVPEEVLEAIADSNYSVHDWDNGDWFVVVDGELVSGPNPRHPFQVHAEAEDGSQGESCPNCGSFDVEVYPEADERSCHECGATYQPDGWSIVHRSIPAEELPHVPDTATTYHAEIDLTSDDLSLTIYQNGETFYLVEHRAGDVALLTEEDHPDHAHDRLEERKAVLAEQ